ncbi:MAG: response regulator transcription factor [Thermoleophilia bacterium]
MSQQTSGPITLALVDDYDVVVVGVAHMFDHYSDRVAVQELDAQTRVVTPVDIALLDTYGQTANEDDIDALVASPRVGQVVMYSWGFNEDAVHSALRRGAAGYLSKALPAADLVAALEAIHAGECVVSPPPSGNRLSTGLDWPGRSEGLSERESEVLALITQGVSNADIAGLLHLSPNSIKSYVRSAYRKIGASTRVQAVLWGVDHGFTPDQHRITHWIPGPGDEEVAVGA